MSDEHGQDAPVDPVEFTRAVLGISPEDAETVRDSSPGDRTRAERDDDESPPVVGQYGPTADYGDE